MQLDCGEIFRLERVYVEDFLLTIVALIPLPFVYAPVTGGFGEVRFVSSTSTCVVYVVAFLNICCLVNLGFRRLVFYFLLGLSFLTTLFLFIGFLEAGVVFGGLGCFGFRGLHAFFWFTLLVGDVFVEFDRDASELYMQFLLDALLSAGGTLTDLLGTDFITTTFRCFDGDFYMIAPGCPRQHRGGRLAVNLL